MSSYGIRFSPELPDDLARAIAWYEREAPHQVPRFREAVSERLDRVVENPLIWQVVYRNVRRVVVRPFPYLLYFQVREDTVIVVAIVHASRHASSWRTRVR